VEVHLLRAEAGVLLGHPEDVVESAERAAEAMPGSLRAHTALLDVYGALGREVPTPVAGVASMMSAQRALRRGKGAEALAMIEGMEGPEVSALALRALAANNQYWALARKVTLHRDAYPNRVEDMALLWKTPGRKLARARREVIESASSEIEGEDLAMLYRTWKLFVLTGETNLALAAGKRIGRLEGTVALPGRLPWGESMIRDLARAVYRSADPVLPPSATQAEQRALWMEMSRLSSVAGEQDRAGLFRSRAEALGAVVSEEPLQYRKLARTAVETTAGGMVVGKGAPSPVIVNLWATWCEPCREELPELAALAQRFEEEGVGVALLAICVDRRRSDFEKFLRSQALEGLPVTWNPALGVTIGGGNRGVVEVLPSTYYIDTEGHILIDRQGYRTGEIQRIEALVRQLQE
jgi:thiol-disulfide isomerase/thioredoxin